MEYTLELIYKKLEEVLKDINLHINNESAETKELTTALARAQADYPQITLNRVDKYIANPYTDLDHIMSKIRPILGRNELSITQRTLLPDTGTTLLQTRLWHSSGQWIETKDRINPDGKDIEAYTSTINEIRKSQIMALLNITISDDIEDDNGYASLKPEYEKGPVDRRFAYKPENESFQTIDKEQLNQLKKELEFIPGTEERLLKSLKIRALVDLPKSKYEDVRKVIMNNKESFLNSK